MKSKSNNHGSCFINFDSKQNQNAFAGLACPSLCARPVLAFATRDVVTMQETSTQDVGESTVVYARRVERAADS